jgi:hypothetical protein
MGGADEERRMQTPVGDGVVKDARDQSDFGEPNQSPKDGPR